MSIAFTPVILGGDIGAYALAREFHDGYGIRSLVVSAYRSGPIAHSRILEHHQFPQAAQEKPLINELLRIGRAHQGPQLILMANTDWRIQVLSAHRKELSKYYLLPFPSLETVNLVGNKLAFAQLCTQVGVSTPYTVSANFSGGTIPSTTLPPGMNFPIIAKPATSAEYENIQFPGKHKVYEITTEQELSALWQQLKNAGFNGTFVVQELIPGDDTAMYSITAYVDQKGDVRMLSSAHVLLEEHHPQTLGNPCAMITHPDQSLLESAQKILNATDYHGFANFDVKRDPRTGKFLFLEVNPRIARNSIYVHAAGVNPMKIMVQDVLEHRSGPLTIAGNELLYTLVPKRLLLRYLSPALKEQVIQLVRSGKTTNPLRNPADRSLYHALYTTVTGLRQYKKFRTYYPRPTHTGF